MVRFGEIEAGQIIKNEFNIKVLQSIIENIINNNPDILRPTQAQVEEIKKEVVEDLKIKYPNSGLEYKTEEKE